MHKRLPWFCGWVLWAGLTTLAWADFQGQVRQIVQAADLRQTQVGLLVVDLATGEELAAINPDEPLMPASNMKLVTTSAALKVLGPDFVFRTELRLIEAQDWPQTELPTAPPVASASPASAPAPLSPASTPAACHVLLVRGDGDPGFGDPELLRTHNMDVEQLLALWVDAAKQAGIDRVERLIVDDRVFDRQLVHPSWPANQLNQWYCAQVAGLNFYDNCLDVYPEPGVVGQSAGVRLIPWSPFLQISNRAVTDKASEMFGFARKPGSNDLLFWGKVKAKRMPNAYNITIHDPPLYFGQVLAHRLREAGIAVGDVVRPETDDLLPAGRTLHVIQTTLPLILERCNKDSQNLFAEALLKRMARARTGAAGSWELGAATVRDVLRQALGTQAAAVTVADGSGMSRDNRVTARVLVSLLRLMHQDPRLGPIFRQSLSVGGSDGTLQRRFRDFQGQLLGKSGYINGVSSLSGYLVEPGPAGERVLAFSLLFNDFKPPVDVSRVRGVQDQIVRLLDQKYAAPVQPVGQGG